MRVLSNTTGRHAARVYAVKIAAHVGMSGAPLATLRMAAAVHDITQMRKADPLWAVSRTGVTRHLVEIGLCANSAAVDPLGIAPVVSAHHEHWDGSGHRRGLRGEEIPIGSRILAVAEAFDRLAASSADFRAERALDTVRGSAGTRFDPQIVDALLSVVREETLSLLAPRDAASD